MDDNMLLTFGKIMVPPGLRENGTSQDLKDASKWGRWLCQMVTFVVSLVVLLLVFVFLTRLASGLFASAAGLSKEEYDAMLAAYRGTSSAATKEQYVNFQGTSSNPLNWPDTGNLHESIRTDGSRAFSYDLPVGSEDTGYRLNVNERDSAALTDAALSGLQ
jgi:hypothetical protein